uniref:Protein kinase domain-containing protein n=1 Tax=Arcella intermedia TaxID=1963864 RepID=A0A6B2LLW1_9EUKA|eukprot:TRINITY_DN11177_c0_g3_i1.p1 TRINITY_DN11177_c0_g3~~TRINITY_DN11177_c0_g3_i1.p1  ORF type:complete len:170 (-),score=42.29 TRINITY_DN11177_c0_g3_i1:27-536(-)
MDYLHQNNILHRDLTTKNILLTADFHAKLADFGLSKKKLEDSSGSNTMGSVPWMAPEVLTNPKSFNRKSDVYSYAICLWEMFTGAQNLLDTEKSMVVLAQEVIRGWRPEIPRTCPAQWGELIQRCWCPEAAERLDFYSVVGVLKSRAFACEVVMMVGSEYVTGLDFGDS